MTRARLVPSTGIAVLCGTVSVSAQAPSSQTAAHPTFGLSVAAEAVPRAVDPVCGRLDGHHVSAALSGYLAVPFGPVALQGGASLHPRGDIGCTGAQILRDGVVTTRSSEMPGGDFIALDLRLRLPGSATRWWHASLGGGWAASGKSIPFVVGSVGAVVRRSVGIGVEVEARSYHVSSVYTTAQYEAGDVRAVLSNERRVEWEHATALRFVLEIPAGRLR